MLKTKTELKAMRLNLAPGQQPVKREWRAYQWADLYDPAQAVPMRPYRSPSPAQAAALAAGRALVGSVFCRTCGKRVDRDWTERGVCLDCIVKSRFRTAQTTAAAWLAAAPLFLDTETTGLDDSAQVCEIALLDAFGAVLFSSLVRPGCPMDPAAAEVHGITTQELDQAPAWPEVHGRVSSILAGRLVIAHNADFDSRLIAQTCQAYDLDMPAAQWGCTKELLAPLNGGRWPRLHQAAAIAGATPCEAPAHRAEHDAETVRRIVIALAEQLGGQANHGN